MTMGMLLAATIGFLAPAQAQESFDAAIQGLTAEAFEERLAAIDTLANLGDPRALPVLEALQSGTLQVRKSDDALVVGVRKGRDYELFDPFTGAPMGTVSRRDVDRIAVNNTMRNAINAALGQLALFDDDPETRRAAVESAMKYPSPEMATALARALETEADPDLRQAMERALAAARLSSQDPAERLAAVEALAGTSDPSVRSLLVPLQNPETEPDPAVREAAAEAAERIKQRLELFGLLANLYQGISLGSVLLLAAIGLAITFGVMGVINMAHGEMIMLGAYTTFVVQEIFRAALPPEALNLYLAVAVPTAFVVTALVGAGLERGVIRFLYGRPLETLLATWGVSLILQQLVRTIFGATNRRVANPDWMTGGFELMGGIVLTYNRLIIIVFAIAVLLALAALLRYSYFGLQMRAVTQNRGMASAMGIVTGRIDAMTFALGSGIAGVAGVALSQVGNVSPNLGQSYIVDSFMVVVFGGVGSLWGVFVGGMSLGIINKFLEPYAGAMLGKVIVLVLIILFIQKRPRGLFALRGRAAEI